jgi:hypothetical protein
MKFPITRETLQALNPEQEKKEKDEIALQFHITSVVNGICQDIESTVLNTRPSQNRKNTQKALLTDKRYIWDLQNIRWNPHSLINNNVNESILIPLLVQKLMDTFIGCKIIIDPLKTYLIIDWS